MPRLFILLFAALLLSASPRPAQALFMTAKELNDGCMAEAKNDISYCLGYIAGVIDYHVMLQSLGTAPTIDFCLPANVTVQQAAVIVLSYLQKAPQNGAFIAAPTVAMALHESFPCAPPAPRRKKNKP
jgi:hypothetical protein